MFEVKLELLVSKLPSLLLLFGLPVALGVVVERAVWLMKCALSTTDLLGVKLSLLELSLHTK